jgi:hypothetical protein
LYYALYEKALCWWWIFLQTVSIKNACKKKSAGPIQEPPIEKLFLLAVFYRQ